MARVTAEEKAIENEDEQDEEAIAPEATERPTRQATAEAAGTGPNENTRVPPAAPAKSWWYHHIEPGGRRRAETTVSCGSRAMAKSQRVRGGKVKGPGR